MDTTFRNSAKSKTSEPQVEIFKLTNKLDLEKMLLYQTLVFIAHRKT